LQLLGFLSSVFVAIFLLYVRYSLLSVAAVITVMHIDGNTQLHSAVKGANIVGLVCRTSESFVYAACKHLKMFIPIWII